MSVRPTSPWTYEDYLEFPDDGRRHEIIEGEAYVTPAPNIRHQDILLWLVRRIADHLDRHGGGRVFVAPVDVVLTDTDVVQPDIVFVADADIATINQANVRGAPTLVVEILSDPRHDRLRKRRLYSRCGVKEYWIVDSDAERVEVYRLSGDKYPAPVILEPGATLATDLLGGFAVEVAALLSAARGEG